MDRTFALFPKAQRWWSFADHGVLMDLMLRLQPKTVLEFGPGSSTLALVEGGAVSIDTCEDNPDWLAVYEERLAPRFWDILTLHAYTATDPLTIPAIDQRRYDFAFVDGPRLTHTRGREIQYALDRCAWVACHDALAPPIVAALDRARADGWQVEVIAYDRNPGEPNAIALIGPRP